MAVSSAAAAHPACPPSVLRADPLVCSSAGGTAAWLGRRQPASGLYPTFTTRILMTRLDTQDPDDLQVIGAALSNGTCPAAVLQRASQHPDPLLRGITAAANPNSRLLMARMASDPHSAVRLHVAEAAGCSPEILAVLAADTAHWVRSEVASHPHCGPSTLARLADDPEADVRKCAAAHMLCPPAALARLADDPEAVVRLEVAHHPRSSPQTLQRLAQDQDPLVRRMVALNMMCPYKVAKALSVDPDHEVRSGTDLIRASLIRRANRRAVGWLDQRRERTQMSRARSNASDRGTP